MNSARLGNVSGIGVRNSSAESFVPLGNCADKNNENRWPSSPNGCLSGSLNVLSPSMKAYFRSSSTQLLTVLGVFSMVVTGTVFSGVIVIDIVVLGFNSSSSGCGGTTGSLVLLLNGVMSRSLAAAVLERAVIAMWP